MLANQQDYLLKEIKALQGAKVISSCASCKVETPVSPQALYFTRYHALRGILCRCLGASYLFHFMHLQCVCGTAKWQRLNTLVAMPTDRQAKGQHSLAVPQLELKIQLRLKEKLVYKSLQGYALTCCFFLNIDLNLDGTADVYLLWRAGVLTVKLWCDMNQPEHPGIALEMFVSQRLYKQYWRQALFQQSFCALRRFSVNIYS